jgi:hypothetical protein
MRCSPSDVQYEGNSNVPARRSPRILSPDLAGCREWSRQGRPKPLPVEGSSRCKSEHGFDGCRRRGFGWKLGHEHHGEGRERVDQRQHLFFRRQLRGRCKCKGGDGVDRCRRDRLGWNLRHHRHGEWQQRLYERWHFRFRRQLRRRYKYKGEHGLAASIAGSAGTSATTRRRPAAAPPALGLLPRSEAQALLSVQISPARQSARVSLPLSTAWTQGPA